MAADCKKGLVFIIAWMTTRKYFVSWASDIVPWNETPCHVMANPVVIAGDFGVDTGVTSLPTVFTPAHNTPDICHVFCIKADQGSSWIPFAAVYGAIVSTWSKKRKQNLKFIYKRAHKGMHRRFFRSVSLPDKWSPVLEVPNLFGLLLLISFLCNCDWTKYLFAWTSVICFLVYPVQ